MIKRKKDGSGRECVYCRKKCGGKCSTNATNDPDLAKALAESLYFVDKGFEKNPKTGIQNIGNSCFLNSLLQLLFYLGPDFYSSFNNKGIKKILIFLQKQNDKNVKMIDFTKEKKLKTFILKMFENYLEPGTSTFRQQDPSEILSSQVFDEYTDKSKINFEISTSTRCISFLHRMNDTIKAETNSKIIYSLLDELKNLKRSDYSDKLLGYIDRLNSIKKDYNINYVKREFDSIVSGIPINVSVKIKNVVH